MVVVVVNMVVVVLIFAVVHIEFSYGQEKFSLYSLRLLLLFVVCCFCC